MKDSSNKKYIAVMVLSVFCLVVIVASVTYAYFVPKIVGEGHGVNNFAGKVKLSISESKITANNVLPIRDINKDNMAQKNEFIISRNEDSNLDACYSLFLVVDNIGENLKSKWFKYELEYLDGGTNKTIEGNFEGIVPDSEGNMKIAFLTNQELNETITSRNYVLRLWLSYSDTEDQSSILMGDTNSRTFSGHIKAEGISGICK